jgi:hypothetical protein
MTLRTGTEICSGEDKSSVRLDIGGKVLHGTGWTFREGCTYIWCGFSRLKILHQQWSLINDWSETLACQSVNGAAQVCP